MAVCSECRREMSVAPSCVAWTLDYAGAAVMMVPYGQETRYGQNHVVDGRCHDCGVAPGGFHHPGCDWAECPRCRGQLLGCGCNYSDDGMGQHAGEVVGQTPPESGSILRVTNEAGDVYDDPSEDLLFDLINELADGNTYLVLERLSDPTGQTYIQTLREGQDRFLVEHRAGGPRQHFRAPRQSTRETHALVTGWAFDIQALRDAVRWERVDL